MPYRLGRLPAKRLVMPRFRLPLMDALKLQSRNRGPDGLDLTFERDLTTEPHWTCPEWAAGENVYHTMGYHHRPDLIGFWSLLRSPIASEMDT